MFPPRQPLLPDCHSILSGMPLMDSRPFYTVDVLIFQDGPGSEDLCWNGEKPNPAGKRVNLLTPQSSPEGQINLAGDQWRKA